VVVPTRDRWPLVDRAVRSALQQEAVRVRVVVVDDGSATPAPAAGALADPRVTVLRRERSAGVGAARKARKALAAEPRTPLLDDDDLWAPHKLATQVAACTATGRRWSYAAALRVGADLRPINVVPAPAAEQLAEMMLHANVVPAGASNVLVATELLRAVGGFDEAFSHLADWELWLRLIEAGPVAAVDEPLVAYVQHPEGMVSTHPASIMREFATLQSRHRDFARRLGGRFTPDELLAWTGHRHLAAGRPRRFAATWLAATVRHRRPALLRRGVEVLRERRRWRSPTPADAPPWLPCGEAQDPGQGDGEAARRVHADVDAPDQ